MKETVIDNYFNGLATAINDTRCTELDGVEIDRATAFDRVIELMRKTAQSDNKVLFCGNGGSAGICSHMATDFFKNGRVPALALNDSSALTCLGNDFGYEFVFSKQIEMIAKPKDMVIAISSSGHSKNILNGVQAGKDANCSVVTFSGFTEDNPLRSIGDVNFFVSASDYGFVETAHLALISAILDIHMGWPKIKY
jgi:D-sedoheptulose 7-phosphate isomerase